MGRAFSVAFILLALVSPFTFPSLVTFALLVVAAFFFPPAALLIGMIYDALYYAPSMHVFALGTLIGLAAFVGGSLVRRFVKTRIMEA